jgi:acetone carboxylase gamma subunit
LQHEAMTPLTPLLHKKPKGLSHHCPTRFAVMHAIARDIRDVKAQLSQMPFHDKYAVAVSNVDDGREKIFRTSVTNPEFWVDLKKVLELMKPVAKAIPKLEADKPLLSTVYTIMMDLMKHAKDWEGKVGEVGTPEAGKLVNSAAKYKRTAFAFEQRITSHMKPAIMAAWLLDPRNMEKVGGVYHLAPDMDAAHKAAALKYITERGTGIDELSALKTEVTSFKIVGIEDSECVDDLDLIKARIVEKKDVGDLCLKFWSSEMGGKKEYPMVSKAATILLGMHASACATERNWSLWGNIFVKNRNNLKITKAEKMVFIRHNTKNAPK